MHSRIFGISTDPQAMSTMNPDEVYDYIHSIDSSVDYVVESDHKQHDIEWFCNCLDDTFFEYDKEAGWFMLKKGAQRQYTKITLNKIIVAATEMLKKEDAGDWRDWYELEQLVRSTGGFYVTLTGQSEYLELRDMDHAIREQFEEEIKYYIIDSLDYHC